MQCHVQVLIVYACFGYIYYGRVLKRFLPAFFILTFPKAAMGSVFHPHCVFQTFLG